MRVSSWPSICLFALVIAATGPRDSFAQNDTRAAARITEMAEALTARIAMLDENYGYLSGGMQRQIESRLANAGANWSRDTYAGHWSQNLAYVWSLNTPNVMDYLQAHVDSLQQVAIDIVRGRLPGAARLDYLQSKMPALKRRTQAIEAVYTSCVFPNLTRAGVLRDKEHDLKEAYFALPVDSERKPALWAEATNVADQVDPMLEAAWACENEVNTLISEPVFTSFDAELVPSPEELGTDTATTEGHAPASPPPASDADGAQDGLQGSGPVLPSDQTPPDCKKVPPDYQEMLRRIEAGTDRLAEHEEERRQLLEKLARLRAELKEFTDSPYTFPNALTARDAPLTLDVLPQSIRKEIMTAVVDSNGGWPGAITFNDLPANISDAARKAFLATATDLRTAASDVEAFTRAQDAMNAAQARLQALDEQIATDVAKVAQARRDFVGPADGDDATPEDLEYRKLVGLHCTF